MDESGATPLPGDPDRGHGRRWSNLTRAGRPPALTPRETDVLRHLARGLTVREVAGQLCISPKTVDAYKTNMMRKLDIHNRVALIRYAIREGVASVEDEQRGRSGGP